MKPFRWILPSLIASTVAVPIVSAIASDNGRGDSDEILLSALPSGGDSLWVQVRDNVSLEQLSSDLSVEEERLAQLNAVPPAHRFHGGDWLAVPRSSTYLLEQVASLDSRAVRARLPVSSPPPITASSASNPAPQASQSSSTARTGVIKLGDTLIRIAQRYGVTLAELLSLNPGLETARLVVGSQVRLAQSSPVRTHALIGLKPVGSGGLSWPDLPGFGEEQIDPAGARAGRWIWPAKGVFSSGYGWRWGRMHKGIDVANNVGTPIVAAQAGRITFAGWHDGGYGYLVEITHEDGSMTRYAHHSRLMVREGDEVQQGQTIGLMGSTGRSTGPHLHFEIHPAGQGAANPMEFLPARA
jgi:murein DD-endopeptidase MepM/ murein hydrolase activator NlpD